MAKLKILEFPDPRLRTKATPVEVVDDSLRLFIGELFETMYDAPGIGLAATQVDVHKRLLVTDVSADGDEPFVLINPEIIEKDGVIAFDLIGQTLGLYPLEKLAEDIGLPVEEMGRGATTFSYNVRDKADVAPLLAKAEAAGGRILRPASDVFWGGHIGYFADPEGNIWEVSHNPYSSLSEDGAFRWNGY